MNSKQNWLRSILICALFAFALSGCDGAKKGYIHVSRVETIANKIMDRHDAYVNADPALNLKEGDTPESKAEAMKAKLKKDIYLDSTKIMRKVLEEAGK